MTDVNFPGPDWDDVLARAAAAGTRRRWAVLAVTAGVAAMLALATPIGGTVIRAVDDFSEWVRGQPGQPVSEEEQRAFEEANARSWLGFPQGTQLRRLETRRVGDLTVDLLGFRSGETLCVRVVVRIPRLGQAQSCAPVRELQTQGSPVRILLTDHGFGRGTKRAWYGVHLVTTPKLRVTAGVVADGVDAVEFDDEYGTHAVKPVSNAVLHVVPDPEPVQGVRAIRVRTDARVQDVPFAHAVFNVGTRPPAPDAPVPGPAEPERPLHGGTIGWLERREPRGEPLDVIPAKQRRNLAQNIEFGRVLAPSPGVPFRVAITISSGRRRAGELTAPPRGVCTWLLMRGGAGGGCMPRDNLFPRGPLNITLSLVGGSQAFMTASGIASDEVARITAFLANGERVDVPSRDNVFAIQLARSKLPGRLVAYDDGDRSIGVSDPLRDFMDHAQPARGRAKSIMRATSARGSTLEILVGPSTAGGVCVFERYRGTTAAGIGTQCMPPDWQREPVQLNTYGRPAEFVHGRVSPQTRLVVIRFADGANVRVRPTSGFVLYTVPAPRVDEARQAVAADAYDASGRKLGSRTFFPPPR